DRGGASKATGIHPVELGGPVGHFQNEPAAGDDGQDSFKAGKVGEWAVAFDLGQAQAPEKAAIVGKARDLARNAAAVLPGGRGQGGSADDSHGARGLSRTAWPRPCGRRRGSLLRPGGGRRG